MGKLDYKQSWIKKIKFVNLLLFVLIIVSIGTYLGGINALVVKGFSLEAAKKHLNELTVENSQIESKKIALESYGDIQQKLNDLHMVPVDKIEYLEINDGAVAKK
ncbi:MAG: hypothetical protein WCK37_02745 [Candidatus Falkowbacteria bacterium]